MGRHPGHRLHQMAVAFWLIASRIGTAQKARFYQRAWASGDCWSKRAGTIRITAMASDTVGSIRCLATLQRR
jgi:hypothetical protein